MMENFTSTTLKQHFQTCHGKEDWNIWKDFPKDPKYDFLYDFAEPKGGEILECKHVFINANTFLKCALDAVYTIWTQLTLTLMGDYSDALQLESWST